MIVSVEETFFCNPTAVTDDDLLRFSLSSLSKNLRSNTSSRIIMSMYLRWLEVHRRNPSHLTEHWVNTILHWTQSLRSRGFRQWEIVSELAKWLDKNLRTVSPSDERQPPSPFDIAKAFDGKVPSPEEQWKAHQYSGPFEASDPSPFDSPPPGNYICNRCGKRGHHVQVCPTNMDPAYDKPPDNNYLCMICDSRGKHFRSLCPMNTGPHSITQKRRRAEIVTLASASPETLERSKHHGRQEVKLGRSNAYADRDLFGEYDTHRSSSTSESPASSGTSTREKLQEIADLRGRLERGDSVEPIEIEMVLSAGEKMSAERDRKRRRHGSPERMDITDSGENESPYQKKARRELFPNARNGHTFSEGNEIDQLIQSVHNPDTISLAEASSDSGNDAESFQTTESQTESAQVRKTYSTFIQSLLDSRREMSQVLNRRRRPTALDFWK